jgi:hypothetical protein
MTTRFFGSDFSSPLTRLNRPNLKPNVSRGKNKRQKRSSKWHGNGSGALRLSYSKGKLSMRRYTIRPLSLEVSNQLLMVYGVAIERVAKE